MAKWTLVRARVSVALTTSTSSTSSQRLWVLIRSSPCPMSLLPTRYFPPSRVHYSGKEEIGSDVLTSPGGPSPEGRHQCRARRRKEGCGGSYSGSEIHVCVGGFDGAGSSFWTSSELVGVRRFSLVSSTAEGAQRRLASSSEELVCLFVSWRL